jgi:protein involved in ribonucleotide reduction
MINVYYFSGTGHSKAVADYFSCRLNVEFIAINTDCHIHDRISIVVFPVYCQNVPKVVSQFLKNIKSEYVGIVATYGKISFGNVYIDAFKKCGSTPLFAAFVPMEHSCFIDLKNINRYFRNSDLDSVFDRIKSPRRASVEKYLKNPFADFLPHMRSRLSIKIVKNNNCISCNHCGINCLHKGIRNGKTNFNCIRCLGCVASCPKDALEIKRSLILNIYLNIFIKENCEINIIN